MSNQYYYFSASLPTISFDTRNAMPVEDFLKSCEEMLSPRDNLLVHSVLAKDKLVANNLVCQQWDHFEEGLRNELAFSRAKSFGKDPAKHVRSERVGDVEWEDLTARLMKEEDPLVAQKMLDTKRWQVLDDLELGHYFDLEKILIYGLKLQICERYQQILSDKGKENLEAYKNIKTKDKRPEPRDL